MQNRSGNRRSADVWLPHVDNRRGEALDFACTSGLWAGMLAASATDPATTFAQYEHYKKTFLDTDRLATEGFFFCSDGL